MYVALPQWQAHFTSTCTTNFPLTREALLDYVRRSDGFAPAEAEAIADRLWELMHQFAEKRGLPPMTDRDAGNAARGFIFDVPRFGVYLGSVLVTLPLLFVLSFFLAARYCRMVRARVSMGQLAAEFSLGDKTL